MANVKISQLPLATSPLDSTVEMPVVQGGVTKRAPVNTIGFLQSGAGAVTRTAQDKMREIVSVEDFGALGNGVANDSAAFAAAITAVAALVEGGDVYIPAGRYLITQQTVPANVQILLDEGAQILPFAATASLFRLTGGLSGIFGGRMSNASSYCPIAVIVDKPFNNFPFEMESCYFASFTTAIRIDGGDCIHIRKNTFNSNTLAIHVTDEFLNSSVSSNYILGGNGVLIQKATQGAEGVTINNNIILPAAGGTYCINMQAGLEIDIYNNILDQVVTGDAISMDGSAGEIASVKIHYNWMGRQAAAAGATYGLYVVNNVRGLIVDSNTFVGFQQANINLNGLGANKLREVRITNNNHYYADAAVRDISLTDVSRLLIDGDAFHGTSSIVENSGVTGRVVNCDFTGSALPSTITSGLRYGDQTAGMTVKNEGSSTVPSPSRAVTITHGLSYTPTGADITVMPTSFSAADFGYFIVDTIGATTFRIVSAYDPTGGGVGVVWRADLTR